MDIIKYFNFPNYDILKIKHMQAGILHQPKYSPILSQIKYYRLHRPKRKMRQIKWLKENNIIY